MKSGEVMNPRIRPFGHAAVLVELDSLDEVLALHRRLAASRPPAVTDLVPAARTILVRAHRGAISAIPAWVRAEAEHATDAAPAPAREIELDIAYDGPDLAETARLLGVDTDALVRRHSATVWRAAFTGFAPGFAYLVGDDWPFDVPRLDAPRTRVPAGAVGLAAGFCGAYPRATPGGWRLIGTTGAPLFDPDSRAPVLLAPGTLVRFRPAAHLSASVQWAPESTGESHPVARPPSARGPGAITVIDPGLRTTVQDLGRPGRASLGIAVSGALDRRALRAANRLVGNAEDAAGLEVTLGGFRATAGGDLWVAVTGGWGPITVDGSPVDPGQAHPWPAGSELHVDWLTAGARAYIAVRGGIDAADAAGSGSTDTLAGLGPAPLAAGDALAVGDAATGPVPPAEPGTATAPPVELVLQLEPGPRADRFAASALDLLFESVWTAGERADRVGVRLDGPALERACADELPSEGMVPGAIQVPPDGRPVILLADGPVTGGYPVIAVVADASLDALGQARPGTRIRFRHAHPPA